MGHNGRHRIVVCSAVVGREGINASGRSTFQRLPRLKIGCARQEPEGIRMGYLL